MFTRVNQTKGSSDLLAGRSVAYFCAEYGISDALPIYSGGLGVLAGDIVQEAAALKLPFVAVGLFYKRGYFHQHLEVDGQHESTQEINPSDVPLELMKDAHGDTLLIEVPIHERIVFAQVWRFPVGINHLYLLDTDHWKNSEADRQITDQLYGGDQAKRIQQEMVLGVGGFRMLMALDIRPDLFHMNEGHSAFMSLELASTYLKADDRGGHDVRNALERAKRHLVFTNHTIVPAGNDLFPHDMLRYYLGKYAFDSGLGIETVLNLGNTTSHPGFFAMTTLALRMSAQSNAVSKLHAVKAKDLWPEFPLLAVTNGVHLPAWVAPELQLHWKRLAPTWQEKSSDATTWKSIKKIGLDELWNAHLQLKDQMLDEVYARTGIRLDLNTLTVVWARRFATYKRPDLLFADLERLKKLLFDAKRPVQVIIAGKSHPADGAGKQIIAHIDQLAQYELKHHAVFVDDYSISLAKTLVSGADIWLNTPIFGYEASGTSGMKSSANGVLQCTVPDGWANEVDWRGLGFTLPSDKAETGLYEVLEKKIVPLYYKRNGKGVPEQWANLMRETICSLSPRFSSQRMVEEYVSKVYTPLLKELK